jgi:uncharacterized membrane protein YphA (DoxX/SURF4 family)
MQEFYKSGRYLFAAAITAFGIIQFVTGDVMIGFLPVFENLPARRFFLYLISTLFAGGGLAMILSDVPRRITILLGFLFAFLFIYPHLIQLVSDLSNPGPWTSSAETLAFCRGAFIIAGDFISRDIGKTKEPRFPKMLRTGRIFFALSLVVFAVQHFKYAVFIGTLIPSWIPIPVFWAYFVGVAFSVCSISLFVGVKSRLACTLLGCMFLFWVIFLHAPRVAANLHKEPEWTSLFVALGFCGIFFTLASQYSGKNPS